MKLLLLLLLGVCLKAGEPLLVVEEALFTRLTNLTPFTTRLTTDGWTPEVLRYDSRIAGGVNLSSRAAISLCQSNIWARVTGGLKHIIFIGGALPCPVSGLNVNPDGHGNTFVPGDGWRDAVNSAGAYKAMQIYGAPNGTYTDFSLAQLSLVVQRMNGIGDGRFDQDTFAIGNKLLAAVGFIGDPSDLAVDPSGLDRRALIINDYFARDIAYRSGAWNLLGASYEYATNSADAHASINWYNQAVSVFGTADVLANAFVVLGSGANVTNRSVGFRLAYTGSSWIPNLVDNFAQPFAAIEFLRLSYQFEVPSGNFIGQAIKLSPNSGPLVCIPWYDSSQGLSLLQLGAGKTIGEMVIAASLVTSVTPISVGCAGDVTLRIVGAGSGASIRNIHTQSVRGVTANVRGN